MPSKKLYALFVGVDKYAGGVRGLNGCVNDVNNLQKYVNEELTDDFQVDIKTLTNEQATREAVITNFQTHLGKAVAGDYVWFHFSGHGSEELTATEFIPYSEDDKNQTLVCHDSRTPNKQDLADKELGALIYEVAKKGTKMIVTLDACHSGGGTRDTVRIDESHYVGRFEDMRQQRRKYDSYLNGYFSSQKLVEVPEASYMVFSACGAKEQALEDGRRKCGLFTASLIDLLKAYKDTPISYNDIASLLYYQIKNATTRQNPQASAMLNFDGSQYFMLDKPVTKDANSGYYLYNMNQEWFVNVGVVHGLNPEKAPLKIHIFDPLSKENKPVAEGEVTSIGINSSKVEIANSTAVSESKKYRVMFLSTGIDALRVYVKDAKLRQTLQANLGKNDLAFIDFNDKLANLDLEVTNENEAFQIRNTKSKVVVMQNKLVENTVFNLLKIERKMRVNRIHNPATSLTESEFSLKLYTDTDLPTAKTYEDSEDIYTLKTPTGGKTKIRLSVENKSTTGFFFMVLYVASDYSIMVIKNEFFASNGGEKFVINKASLGITNPALKEAQEEFLLLVSNERMEENFFRQSKLIDDTKNPDRGRDLIFEEELDSKWLVKRVKIKLVNG